MPIMGMFRRATHRFRSETSGSVPAEGVLAATLLFWWYMASVTFFDAYQQRMVNTKAAYTLADMLSRQTSAVTPQYIIGMNRVYEYLTRTSDPTWIRVSSVYWDDRQDRYEVQWSFATGGKPKHTNATIANYEHRIPTMPEDDTVVVVETFMSYKPLFNVGLDGRWFDSFITTRPRFGSCVPFSLTGASCSFFDSSAPITHNDDVGGGDYDWDGDDDGDPDS